MSDLEETVRLRRRALELHPQGHPERSDFLINLAVCLYDRFMQVGGMSDLEEAITLDREALDLCPPGHPDRSLILVNLSPLLSIRFFRLGTISDIDEATALIREALDLRPSEHPGRLNVLINLSKSLADRFTRLGAISDLEEAITYIREASTLCPKGHPHRCVVLASFAGSLTMRFRQLGVTSDLEEAITLSREALDLTPHGHPGRYTSLLRLTACLTDRFRLLAEMSDLHEVIALSREAIDLHPPGHHERPTSLSTLVANLSDRFRRPGVLSDLEEAITLSRESLDLSSDGHPLRFIYLSNLAGVLSDRYAQLGVGADLAEAVTLHHDALDLCPPGHPQRFECMLNLAALFFQNFTREGVMSSLDEAIKVNIEALELCPRGHPNRPRSLTNLSVCLSHRFQLLSQQSDIDEAIAFSHEALEITTEGNIDRAIFLDHLVAGLSDRFQKLGAMSDLEEAITRGWEALDLRPVGHPSRSFSLVNLANCVSYRYKRLGITPDRNKLFFLYSSLSDETTPVQAISFRDLATSRDWINAAEEHGDHTAVLAYRTSLRLLVNYLVSFPSLTQHHAILKSILSSLAVDAVSACVRQNTLPHAVELVEQGRGVFGGQLVRLRLPLDDVSAASDAGQQLAERFRYLTFLIRSVHDSPSGSQGTGPTSEHERVWHLNVQLQAVVSDIRALLGFSRFLLPPEFSDLRQAAREGPVIIVNGSQYGCDALIILSNQSPVHIPLPTTKAQVQDLCSRLSSTTARARHEDVTIDLVIILRELWRMVVSPIVDALQEVHPAPSRIWWCPTAEFSILPLHAAGAYGRTKPKSLSDLYISSYTTTLSAFIRARQYHPSDAVNIKPHFLAIGQAQAPGQNVLTCINAELDNLAQRMTSLTTFTCLQDATISKVGEYLQKSEFVHLACHGIPDRKQLFDSAFALGDGHLKIEALMQYQLQNPCFAYLSACHTMVGDEDSPDEVIHLAAAMQFAGFKSVIGTMWAVDDAYTNEMTEVFYRNMVDERGCLDHTRAALALHKTLRSVKIPFDQRIVYIHIGA